jgi:hypothetical protein
MVISGVVTDDHHALAFLSASLLKEFHEIPEALPVKSIRLARMNKLAVAQAHGSKLSYTLCWREGSNVTVDPESRKWSDDEN